MSASLILAPLRGVTIRAFRETFADEIAAAGFDEAVTPFIAAQKGFDPLKDRELAGAKRGALRLTPQFIGKDPSALRDSLLRILEAGFGTADLNCGCPFPMVRNKGRGSGLLRTPRILEEMISVGCEVMGPGRFSVKARLGIDRNDELEKLMPMVNSYPLRFLTVHARTARQMYEGACDWTAYDRIRRLARVPIVRNGDIAMPPVGKGQPTNCDRLMIGRGFVRALGARSDSSALALRYLDSSVGELYGDNPVLGRMKELLSYWRELPFWNRRWNLLKLCRSVDELRSAVKCADHGVFDFYARTRRNVV